MIGKVKKLTDKGFGFLTPEGEHKDVFFHAKNLDGVAFADLRAGDTVEFEVEDNEKGPRAVGVHLV